MPTRISGVIGSLRSQVNDDFEKPFDTVNYDFIYFRYLDGILFMTKTFTKSVTKML